MTSSYEVVNNELEDLLKLDTNGIVYLSHDDHALKISSSLYTLACNHTLERHGWREVDTTNLLSYTENHTNDY